MKRFTYQYKDISTTGVATTPKGWNIIWDSGNSYSYIYGFNSVFEFNPFLEDAIIPEVTYSEHEATYTEKTVKAWTFYCDSHEAELDINGWSTSDINYNKGNGSKENPWRNLDYAIKKIAGIRKCLYRTWSSGYYNGGWLCCPDKFYFQIKVKGILNYKIGISSWQDADQNEFPYIIIAPWKQGKVELLSPRILYISGLFFEKCKFINTSFSSENNAMFFYDCDFDYTFGDYYDAYFGNFSKLRIIKCYFENNSQSGGTTALCINQLGLNLPDTIQLIDCHCKNIITGYRSVVTVYNSDFYIDKWWTRDYYPPICGTSKFYNVKFYYQDDTYYYHRHIYNASDCVFYNVELNIDGTADAENRYDVVAMGFSQCNRSVFQNCSVNITPPELKCSEYPSGSGKFYGYIDMVGFIDNTDAVYSNCSTTNICQKCANETHECMTPDF